MNAKAVNSRSVGLHCVKSVRIRIFSSPYCPAFGLNTDQKKSRYGHFSRNAPVRLQIYSPSYDYLANDDYFKNDLFAKYVVKINPYRKFGNRYRISSIKRQASNTCLHLISTTHQNAALVRNMIII